MVFGYYYSSPYYCFTISLLVISFTEDFNAELTVFLSTSNLAITLNNANIQLTAGPSVP